MPSFGGWKVKIHICQDGMGYSIGLGGMKIPATCCAFVARLFMRYKCVYMTMIVVHICKLHSATKKKRNEKKYSHSENLIVWPKGKKKRTERNGTDRKRPIKATTFGQQKANRN